MVYRAFVLYSIVFLFCGPAFCEPAVDLVIADGEFGQYLSNDSAISRVPDGRVINIAFRYVDYDFRHPYLIADRFCGGSGFIRWGSAQHPSAGPIDLVCVKESQRKAPQLGGIGN